MQRSSGEELSSMISAEDPVQWALWSNSSKSAPEQASCFLIERNICSQREHSHLVLQTQPKVLVKEIINLARKVIGLLNRRVSLSNCFLQNYVSDHRSTLPLALVTKTLFWTGQWWPRRFTSVKVLRKVTVKCSLYVGHQHHPRWGSGHLGRWSRENGRARRWVRCCKMLSSGHAVAVAFLNSQWPWLSAKELHTWAPRPATEWAGLPRPRRIYRQLVIARGRRDIFFLLRFFFCFLIISSAWLCCLHLHLCSMCMPSAFRSQKKVWDSPVVGVNRCLWAIISLLET